MIDGKKTMRYLISMLKFLCRVWLVLLFLFPASALALNVQNLRFYFPQHRAANMIASEPQAADTLSMGLKIGYAMRPFEFGSSAGNVPQGAVTDHLFTMDLGAGYSLTDRLAIGVNLPIHVSNGIVSFANTSQHSVANLGDITLSGLWNLLRPKEIASGIGLSVVPFLTLPTGDGFDFVGDTSATGGFLVAADVNLFDEHYIGINAGMRFRQNENILNLTVGQEFLYNIAYEHTVWPAQELGGFVQLMGSMSLSEVKEISSPVEILFGLNKGLLSENRMKLTLTNGFGLGSGYGTPDYRVQVGVSYNHPIERRPPVVVEQPRVQKIEKRLKELTIYYPTDGAQVDPFYDEKITEIAQILKDNPDLGPLYILGHTDDVASDRHNEKLSQKRAKQAYDSLMKNGVSESQVVWRSFGEKYPVVPNDSPDNRALNRRTMFTFQRPDYWDGGPSSLSPSQNDSYTEVLKKREVLNPTLLPTIKKRVEDGVIIEEEIKIEKQYDPKTEYNQSGRILYKPRSNKDDSYTNTLKHRSQEETRETSTSSSSESSSSSLKPAPAQSSPSTSSSSVTDTATSTAKKTITIKKKKGDLNESDLRDTSEFNDTFKDE